MYKHILISTDGSDVAQRGVDHGLSLAKSLDAKVTVITVTEPFPFHASAAGAGWVPLPEDISGYEEGQKEAADKLLATVREVGRQDRRQRRRAARARREARGSHRRDGEGRRMQPDRHGVAWPPRPRPPASGQPDRGSARPQSRSRARRCGEASLS